MFDAVIRNVRIVDGSGNPWFTGSVGIADGRISGVWRAPVAEVEADEVIEGSGLVLCPGVIDVHGHTDFSIMSHPGARNLVSQGITTQAVGQCGFSMYAFSDEYASEVRRTIKSVTSGALLEDAAVDWRTLDQWRERVEDRGISLNLVPYVGHNTLRCSAMGDDGDRRVDPTPQEMQKMKDLLRGGLEEGAFGLSTGLRYPHGRNAHTDEVVQLCEIAASYGGVHISHMRSEEEYLLPAVQELIQISERTSVPGCATHHKAMFFENWGSPAESLRMLKEARERGTDVLCDLYPWTYAREVNLGTWFGGHLLGGGQRTAHDREALLRALGDDEHWRDIKEGLIQQHDQLRQENLRRQRVLWRRGVYVPAIWDPASFDCVMSSPGHPELFGSNFSEIARILNVDDHWEAMRRLYLEDEGRTLVAAGPISEHDVRRILSHPLSMVGTDSTGTDINPDLDDPQGGAHPRSWGTYPRVLGEYVREQGVLSLEEAVRKMTSLPASFLNLQRRGMIREGFWADLLLFDPDSIA
ncbi:MAG: amidohydrolase family protein, partial [Bacillota bacterium]